MHHPSTGHASSVVVTSASGSLGVAVTTSHTLTLVNHVQTTPLARQTAPTQHQHHEAHHDNQHHEKH